MGLTAAVNVPKGFHFDYEEVKTAHGTKSLGEVPILVCDDLEEGITVYTEDGIKGILDGTSLRVSFQGIARRLRAAGKSDDEIAEAQIKFRPGTRAVGASTPASRASRAAKLASEKVDGDAVAAFLKAVADGKITAEDLAAVTPPAPAEEEAAQAGAQS